MPFILAPVPTGRGTVMTFEEWLDALRDSLPNAINMAFQYIEDGWDDTTNFDENDILFYGGVYWHSLQPNIDVEPGTDGAVWRRLIDTPAQNQIQSFGYVGISAILRVGTRTDNFAPGDSTASIKTKLAGLYTDYGALSSDFGISGTNTAPPPPPLLSFTISGTGDATTNGAYSNSGTYNSQTQYVKTSRFVFWVSSGGGGNGKWVVAATAGGTSLYESAIQSGATPFPTTGWITTGGTGSAPSFSSLTSGGSDGTFALLITTQGALAGKNLPALESDTTGVTLAVTQAANIAGPPASIASLQEERQARALKTDKSTAILAWAYGQSYRLVSGTRDSNGALTSGTIIWPDGATGAFTADTLSTAFPGAVDAYHVTHVLNAVTTTYTQPAVTRDATTGAVTAQPAIIVS